MQTPCLHLALLQTSDPGCSFLTLKGSPQQLQGVPPLTQGATVLHICHHPW
ncbi:hypothetical protein LEMLEM_LOCUS17764, partial [Lemmus lemmus]